MNHLLFVIGVLSAAASLCFGYTQTDLPEGWASQGGGTTGGIGGEVVTVSTFEDLKREASSAGKKIILVKKGTYSGVVELASDKSLLGLEPGVLINGNLTVDGVRNVIVRNIAVKTGEKCTDFSACRGGSDAVHIGNEAYNVWFDHVDISDGQDGNCDVTKVADFITFTWCKFWYSYPKEHSYSNLIASSNNESASEGKMKITFAYCWWADNVEERQPWGRFGRIHLLNNLHTSQRTVYANGTGFKMQQLIEANVYNCTGEAVKDKGGEHMCIDNIGTNPNITCNDAGVFTPPYTLSLRMQATDVEAAVRSGAGNILTLGEATGLPAIGKGAINLRKPFIWAASDGWFINNPGERDAVFSITSVDGKTLHPSLHVSPGGVFKLSGPPRPVYIKQ